MRANLALQKPAGPLCKQIALASLLLTDGVGSRARDANFKLTVLLFSTKLKQFWFGSSVATKIPSPESRGKAEKR